VTSTYAGGELEQLRNIADRQTYRSEEGNRPAAEQDLKWDVIDKGIKCELRNSES
jgi:hypothetical protein